MKTIIKIWIYPLVIMGMVFMLTSSCKKDKDEINSPPPSDSIVKDIDGNVYHTVTIGTQLWMAENLRATQYNDLTPIPLINWNDWNQQTNGAYNWFDNDITFKLQFGAFYNWYAVNTGKLCPEDWHVPSETEWQVLEDFLKNNGYSYQENGDGYIPVRDGDGVAKSLASMGSQILLY